MKTESTPKSTSTNLTVHHLTRIERRQIRIEKKLNQALYGPWMSKRDFYMAERWTSSKLEKLIAAKAWEQGEIPEFKPRPGGRNLYCSTKDYTAWLERREKRGRA